MISSISSGYSSATTSWSQMSRPDPSEMSKELFTTTDTDGDGVISKTELSTALDNMAQANGTTAPDADKLFNALDQDGDGSITEEEQETGLASLHKDLASQSWMTTMQLSASSLLDDTSSSTDSSSSTGMPTSEELFSATDTNGDGSISLDELTAALKDKGNGNGPSAEDLFSALDANGDGSISEAEQSEGLANMQQSQGAPPMGPPPSDSDDTTSLIDELFNQTDTDGDGILDKDELTSAMSSSDSTLLENFFNTFDTDSSGTITASEISSVLNPQSQSTSLAAKLTQNAYMQYQYMDQDLQNLYASGSFTASA